MKIFISALFALSSMRAYATDCEAKFLTESNHGRGPSLRFTNFSADAGYALAGNYKFNLNSTTHGESQILTIATIQPSKRIFRERRSFSQNGPNPIWEIVLSVGDESIEIDCR